MTGKRRAPIVFRVIGYAPHESVMVVEDYEDFPLGMEFNVTEILAGLEHGVYPPGLLVKTEGGVPGVVRGSYGYDEWIEVVE